MGLKPHDNFAIQARHALASGSTVLDAIGHLNPYAVGVGDVTSERRHLRALAEGIGPLLYSLLNDEKVTDVLINSTHGVWIDRGNGLERVPQVEEEFTHESDVRALAVRLASAAGKRLDDSAPIVDATFPNGLRLHALLPPLGAQGTLISLRTQPTRSFSLDELEERAMFPPFVRRVLDALVSSKANIMISGSTGSGKTTLLSAMLSSVPATERLLIIEESAELRPRHEHAVHLQARLANVQGVGEVGMSELVRAAMRMRPDRIILGECRGAEVRDVLSALNTGHEGGCATIHANSAVDVPARLVALGALAGMSEHVVAAQATSALDAVIHVSREAGKRYVSHIAVLERRASQFHASLALSCTPDSYRLEEKWGILEKRICMEKRGGEVAI